MFLNYNNDKYEIVVIRKNNKNTYIRVKEDLKIYITTGLRTTNKYIDNLINENYESITKMIDRAINKNNKKEKCMILGNEIDIIKLSNQEEPEIYNNKLYIKDLSKLDNFIKEYAYSIFKERLDNIYNMFSESIPYPKLKIRKMTTRWGVCNRRDNSITLNLDLIRMDIKYLDYVIVHELSHFVHFDHSKDFWNTVSKYCSDYKELRKEMRD